jgi:hypothetical protein
MGQTYRVKWEIDVEADSLTEAAGEAFTLMRCNDPGNIATVFQVQVWSDDPQDCWDEVDLSAKYPVTDWRCEFVNGDTSRGYPEWVASKIEQGKE